VWLYTQERLSSTNEAKRAKKKLEKKNLIFFEAKDESVEKQI